MVATRREVKLVTLTIDGQEVTVPAGTTILQAAESAGIELPNMCFQPLLRPWGSCRVCTVEIQGPRGGLIESCAAPVRDGQEVLTQTPACLEARTFLLQMYLVDHALDCPTCDKSGECYLQDNTYLHNVDNSPFRRPKIAKPYNHFSDYIDYKWDRCIMCSRCVRVCDEMIGVTAITIAGRGLEAEVTPSYGLDLLQDTACTNCGMCIAVCPVGALTDRHFGHHPWELDAVETICGFCDVGCTLNVEHNRGLVRRVTHLWDRGVNLGYTCERGKWGHEQVQDPLRLRYARYTEHGDTTELDIDDALDIVAERFQHAQGSGFAALASQENTNEDNYALQQFTRAVMGSNNIDRFAPTAAIGVDSAMHKSFGNFASSGTMQEMREDSSCVLILGPDLGFHEAIASYWVYWAMRYRETQVIAVTADHQFLCDRSNHWIKPEPGTEADVLNAMTKIILDAGLGAAHTDVAALRASVANVDVDAVAAAAGVSAALLRESALLYATGGKGVQPDTMEYPASSIWHTFAVDTPNAETAALAANNLALACGNIGRPGGGVIAFRRYANAQGTLDVGCHPDYLPGGNLVSDSNSRTALANLWGERWNPDHARNNGFKPQTQLPTAAGIGVGELAAAIRSGRVTTMYVSAHSHRWSGGIDADLLDALGQLEFLVVEDCFDSDLTSIAHVVLPAAMSLEKDGTFTNVDRLVQRVRYTVGAPGDANGTAWFVSQIAQRLGYYLPAANASAMFDEISRVVPDYAAMSYPRLERDGMRWPTGTWGEERAPWLSTDNGLTSDAVRIVAD